MEITLAAIDEMLHVQKEVGAYGSAATTNRQEKQGATAASDPAALSNTSHTPQIADMMRAIRENGTPLVDGHAARRPVEIMLGIYESARTQQEVILS